MVFRGGGVFSCFLCPHASMHPSSVRLFGRSVGHPLPRSSLLVCLVSGLVVKGADMVFVTCGMGGGTGEFISVPLKLLVGLRDLLPDPPPERPFFRSFSLTGCLFPFWRYFPIHVQ